MNPTDEQLLASFLNGDKPALEELAKKYQTPLKEHSVRKYFYYDEPSSEDAVQETFKAVVQYAKTFNPAAGTFKDWLYAICNNKCLKILREKNRNYRPLLEGPEGETIDIEDKGLTGIPESVSQKLDQIRDEYLDILEENDKKLVILRLDKKTYREIQDSLKLKDEQDNLLSEDALQKRYSRALDKLTDYHSKRRG